MITKDGTLGRVAIVDRIPLCINQSVAVLRPKQSIDGEFLKLLLESPECQERILADTGGSTIKHIYISKINKVLIAVPTDTSEQHAIRTRLLTQSDLITQMTSQLGKLNRLRAGLMHDLLTGDKRVTALLDEREAVLT